MQVQQPFSFRKAAHDGVIMLLVATAFMFVVEVLIMHKSIADSLWLRSFNAPINFLIGLVFSFLRTALKMEQRNRVMRFLLDSVALTAVQVPIYLFALILNNSTSVQIIQGAVIVVVSSLLGGVYGLLFDRVGKKELTS